MRLILAGMAVLAASALLAPGLKADGCHGRCLKPPSLEALDMTWAVVKTVDAHGKVVCHQVQQIAASCPAKTVDADGSRRIILKRFDAEADARQHYEKHYAKADQKEKSQKTEKADNDSSKTTSFERK